MTIEVKYIPSECEFTVMLDDYGVVKDKDGRIRLWYKPF